MSSKRNTTPKSSLRIKRPAAPALPAVGETILVRALVTRTGRNRWDTADTITVRIADHPVPITATAKYLIGEGDD